MTTRQAALVVAVTAVGFAIGFYAGLVLLLSIVGLDDFRGWQFPLATIPTGSAVGGLAAGAVAPGKPWLSVLVSALAAGLVAMGIVYLTDGDFAVAILLGGAAVVAATTAASAANARNVASGQA